jgi:hypothetical protein
MKTRLRAPSLFPLLCSCCFATAAEEPAVSARFVDAETPAQTEIRALGERTISRLAVTMANEVAGAGTAAGAEKAFDVCHLKALPSSGVIIKDSPRITAVKRTSLRVRNPANAPDAAEQLALKQVERDLEKGVVPKVLLQQIDLPGGKSEWRVYRPIAVLPQCAYCHGPAENLSSELQTRLKERYPGDKATGYAAGNWRGLIRVTVAEAPPPSAPAAKTAPAAKAKKK